MFDKLPLQIHRIEGVSSTNLHLRDPQPKLKTSQNDLVLF